MFGVRSNAVAFVLTAIVAFPVARAATSEQVQHAINGGRDYLFSRQKNGNWEVSQTHPPLVWPMPTGTSTQWGGMTAIATLSLLASGVPADDPHLKPAIEFLKSADIRGNYAMPLRAQVLALLPPDPALHRVALADCKLLEVGLHIRNDHYMGLYGYLPNSPVSECDHSVSQFAVLGMWALAQSGVEVPGAYWHVVDEGWRHQQYPDGSWSYYPDRPGPDATLMGPGLSMTAAGVATLYIAQEYNQITPRCNGNVTDPSIDAGLKYIGSNLQGLGWLRRWYTLFAVSRVGLASGYKYIGPTDWFKWGSDLAVACQGKDGSWHNGRDEDNVNGIADTSFALLFLARGRAPVMLDKLQYDIDPPPLSAAARRTPGPVTKAGTWNQRPRDAANLARWVGRQIESSLGWQVVNLQQPAGDLHDAPILYVAGGRAPVLTPDEEAKLRAYCEDGGMVLGHADCSSPEFSKGFRDLGKRLFPNSEFRMLEANSPVVTEAGGPPPKVAVEALSNGARELMVLLPNGDPARQWQAQSFQSGRKDAYGQLMLDLFLYSVDKEGLRRRGDTYLVDRTAAVPNSPTAAKLARVKYAGNWDPEPGGWRRLSNVMHNEKLAELSETVVDPARGGAIDPSTTMASITFTAGDARLSETVRAAIRTYVRGGGTILVDCAGGGSPARSAAEAELARLFPDAPRQWAVLPATDPVFAAAGATMSAATVDYRRFNRESRSAHEPRLRGWSVGGRTAVFYSPEDVSVGLVGQPIDGVAGYAPADATKIVADIIAYAGQAGRPK